MAKYTGWIMLFAIAGTLAAVAAIAITEAFVPAGLRVLTTGEWELLSGDRRHCRRGDRSRHPGRRSSRRPAQEE